MKPYLIAALGLSLSMLTTPAGAQVFKCTVDGKTVFSDRPCPSGADAQAVRIFDRGPTEADAAAADQRAQQLREQLQAEEAARDELRRVRGEAALERMNLTARSREAVAQRRVFVGMPAADARKSWGEPTRVNRTITAGSDREQWVYRRASGKTQYVYVEDGVVTAIQE